MLCRLSPSKRQSENRLGCKRGKRVASSLVADLFFIPVCAGRWPGHCGGSIQGPSWMLSLSLDHKIIS